MLSNIRKLIHVYAVLNANLRVSKVLVTQERAETRWNTWRPGDHLFLEPLRIVFRAICDRTERVPARTRLRAEFPTAPACGLDAFALSAPPR